MAASIEKRRLLFVLTILVIFLTKLTVGKKSAIVDIKESSIYDKITSKEFLLVFFYDDMCTSCKENLVQLERVADSHFIPGMEIVQINSKKVAASYGLSKDLPKVVFFRSGRPIIYDVVIQPVEADDLVFWMEQNKLSFTKRLNQDDFEHLTQAASGATTGDWLVLFFDSSCDNLLATLDTVASRIKHKMNTAAVDMALSPNLKKRFEIEECPTIIYFRHGNMYRYNIKDRSVHALVSFTEGWYQNLHAVKVPLEPSPFDSLTDSIAAQIREHLEGPHGRVYACVCGGVALLVLGVVLCCAVSFTRKGDPVKYE